MTELHTTEAETRAERIARLEGMGWGPTRILAAEGLPGFGVAHARRALALFAELGPWGASLHACTLGGPHASRELGLAREARRHAGLVPA